MAEKRLGDQQNDPNQSDCILLPTCKRSRGSRIASTQCPVCGLTLREGQFQQHYEAEVEKVALLRTKKRKHRPSIGEDGREDGESSKQKSASDRAENVLTDVRRHRLVWRCTNPLSRVGNSPQDGQMCPLCGENVPGTADELISHVDACIQRNGPDVSDALSEEEELGTYEEYEWAGQTRIRVSTLVPPSALPDHVVVKRQGGGEGEGLDADVDIEGDGDVDDFGPHQYKEEDLIPCGSDSSEDEGKMEGQGSAGVVHQVDQCSLPGAANTDTRTSEESCSIALSDQRGGAVNATASPSRKNKGRAPQHVYQLQLKCPVCMDSYRDPVVSVKCWHVFCDECWLRALGAKKLCPKCSLITAASDLRRVYL